MLCKKYTLRKDGTMFAFGARAAISVLCEALELAISPRNTTVSRHIFKIMTNKGTVENRRLSVVCEELCKLQDATLVSFSKSGQMINMEIRKAGEVEKVEVKPEVIQELDKSFAPSFEDVFEDEAEEELLDEFDTAMMETDLPEKEVVEEAPKEAGYKDVDWAMLEALKDSKENRLLVDNYAKDFEVKLDRRSKVATMLKKFREALRER